ncbi:hypothetical protein TRIUR3_15331 [Triticum urartu]|uniref:Uncharacterized protein n=1 Tax=Triticum urartu TaxID=4572 RepID=M8ADI1_TRIUA|nr:hypothetical protein TRIUR3_15331 [Triticum urartu]
MGSISIEPLRPRLVSRADYLRALIPLGGISMDSPTPLGDYHASLVNRGRGGDHVQKMSQSSEGAKTLMQMEDLEKEEGDGCGPSPSLEGSFDPEHRREEVRGIASVDGACCSLVSLEMGVSFPISGVVAFLPVEAMWVGQGYLPYRCIQMSRRVSRGQLSPRFSGPGK